MLLGLSSEEVGLVCLNGQALVRRVGKDEATLCGALCVVLGI